MIYRAVRNRRRKPFADSKDDELLDRKRRMRWRIDAEEATAVAVMQRRTNAFEQIQTRGTKRRNSDTENRKNQPMLPILPASFREGDLFVSNDK